MSRVGIGIVGVGGIFEQHARAVSELSGRARIVAVCDVDATRLASAAARYDVPIACVDHRELVEHRDVDVVAVCTPPGFHADVVIDALAAGKHVICEKPLARTLADADRILVAANGRPGRLSVVYQFRCLPEVRRALWLRDQGGLGALLSGRFHRFARFRRPGKPDRAGWWGRWDVAGGGAVMTQLIHELDLMCLFFGRPARAWAAVDTLKEAIESEDTCAAVVQFGSGAICTAQSTMSAHRSSAGFDVFGSRARSTPHGHSSAWTATAAPSCAAPRSRRSPTTRRTPRSCAHTPYLASVLDALESGAPLPSGPEQARLSLELATAIYASSLSGEPVALPLGSTHSHYDGVSVAEYAARPRFGFGFGREVVGVG